MSFPALLKKLFTNNGAGDKLNSSLLPDTLSGVPVGTIISYAGKTIPDGWLLCNGAELSIDAYPELHAAIGTVFGQRHTQTFTLPDLVDKYICGAARAGTDYEDDEAEDDSDIAVQKLVSPDDLRGTQVGAEKEAGLPNITGGYFAAASAFSISNSYGALTAAAQGSTKPNNSLSGTGDVNVVLNASKSSAIYGNSTTVTPPSLPMFYIIKY